MNVLACFRSWFLQWRRKQTYKKAKTMLREFVYLDEVSIYSLFASKLGPIATEFTETQTASLQGEFSGSIGGSFSAGLAKVNTEVAPSVLASRTHGTQVLRKSIVQTTFKEFYELEASSFAIQPIGECTKPPKVNNLNDLIAKAEELTKNGWLLDPAKLSRGQLLEVEVQLEAESIFRISAVLSAILEIIDENPEMFGFSPGSQLAQAKSIEHILEKLLVGLVPIRGHAIDYEIVKLEQKEWIIHRRLLNELPIDDLSDTYSLWVVGVTEQSLFWKDIRRVLFSNARFRVLCRVAQDGLQDFWTPVKLASVLNSMKPGLGDRISALGSGMFTTISELDKPDQKLELKQQFMRDALVNYATLLADHYNCSFAAQDLSEIQSIAGQYSTSFSSMQERRKAFDTIATYVLDRFELGREPLAIAQYREVALTDAGLNFLGQPTPLTVYDDAISNNSAVSASSRDRFLDSEFIAIYW